MASTCTLCSYQKWLGNPWTKSRFTAGHLIQLSKHDIECFPGEKNAKTHENVGFKWQRGPFCCQAYKIEAAFMGEMLGSSWCMAPGPLQTSYNLDSQPAKLTSKNKTQSLKWSMCTLPCGKPILWKITISVWENSLVKNAMFNSCVKLPEKLSG